MHSIEGNNHSLRSFASKSFPDEYWTGGRVHVRILRSSEHTRWFSQMTPDEHPRRNHLADGPLSSREASSLGMSSFGSASVMMSCSARPACSSAPSVLSEVRISRNIIYTAWFCYHINTLHISTELCRFEVRLEVYDGPAWSYVSPVPGRHRRADGQLSPISPLLPSLSLFGADCVKRCCLLPPWLGRTVVVN